MKAFDFQFSNRGLSGVSRVVSMLCLALALTGGCSKHEAAHVESTGNPETDATLARLSKELRRTMIGRRLNGSFDEFVSIRHPDVPPPPTGKKYAISKKWKVVLVDAN